MARKLYPLFIDLADRFVVVVGGGKVAERKIKMLLECRADVRVVAPEVTHWIAEAARDKRLELLLRSFHPADVHRAFMVFAATNHSGVNSQVCQSCDNEGIIVNRAEAPEASDFVVPSVLRRGEMTIAVSTGGASPHLGQRIRDQISSQFGSEYAEYMEILGEARAKVLRDGTDPEARRRALRALAEDEGVLEALKTEGRDAATRKASQVLRQYVGG